mmetsp:Transcript_28719/g.66651  ORF Transcript_28719/g.66651 Transcript_28719/m.66651 type:complete len:345 (-) Transcript_28719:7-1041(-)
MGQTASSSSRASSGVPASPRRRRTQSWMAVQLGLFTVCCSLSQPLLWASQVADCAEMEAFVGGSCSSTSIVPSRRIIAVQAKPTPFDKDEFWTKKAREENLPARSYYKLEEIDRKVNLFQNGMSVLDLGCAPGSWSIYASRRIGRRGQVVGLDLLPVTTVLPNNVQTMVADVHHLEGIDIPVVDVLMSDMAPSTIGVSKFDHGNSAELVRVAMKIADQKVRRGGSFVAKILDGAESKTIMLEMRDRYENVKKFRVKATRTQSNEMYFIGTGKKLVPDVAFQHTDRASMGSRRGGPGKENPVGGIPSFMQYEVPPQNQRRKQQRQRQKREPRGSSKEISHNFEGW